MVDDLLKIKKEKSKAELKRAEVVAGFTANEHGLMAEPVLRQLCPPSALHLYYSNGIAAWETNNLISRLADFGCSSERLFEIASRATWTRSKTENRSPSWWKQLFHESRFTGDAYRGSAEDLRSFLPRQHQDLYIAAYSKDACKPKHHVRFHLPAQIEATQCYMDCFPMEKQHKRYKTSIGAQRFETCARGSRSADGKFSEIMLTRFFANQLGSLKTYSFHDTLVKPMKERLDLQGRKFFSASKAKLNGKLIHTGDILLNGTYSGLVTDLVAEENGKVYIWMKILVPVHADLSCSRWKITQDMVKQCGKNLGRRPAFWSFENTDELLCI